MDNELTVGELKGLLNKLDCSHNNDLVRIGTSDLLFGMSIDKVQKRGINSTKDVVMLIPKEGLRKGDYDERQ